MPPDESRKLGRRIFIASGVVLLGLGGFVVYVLLTGCVGCR